MDTVHKLILSGINGRMRPGDVFSIWTFNDLVYTNRYAVQQWIPSRNQDIANRAYRYLRDQNFSKKTRMDLAVAAMSNVVRRADAMTLLFFTDGSHLLKGTPFDEPINSIFNKHAEGMRSAKKPFVTTFIAQGGKLVAHAVSPAGGPIYIPPTLAEINAQGEAKETAGSPRAVAEARQNNATEQNAPVPPKADPSSTNHPKPLTVEQISALLRESQKKSAAEPSTNAPAPLPTTPAEAPATAVAQEQPKPTPPPIVNTEPAIAPATTPQQPSQPTAAERTPIQPAQGNTIAIQPRAVDATSPNANRVSDNHVPEKTGGGPDAQGPASQQTATVLALEPVHDSQKYLFFGLGLLVVALASAWLLLRNRRFIPKPSLISRSLDDGKK